MRDDNVLKKKNVENVTSVEKFKQKSWDRDEISTRVDEVESTVSTIETILQDINEQLEAIPSSEELKDEYSSFIDNIPKDDNGNPKQLPRPFVEAERDRFTLMKRQALWQARLKELEGFVRKKIFNKFMALLDEFRLAENHETLEEMFENKAEHFVEVKLNEKAAEIETRINQLEKLAQALREERKSDRETQKVLAEAADGVDESEFRSIIDEAFKNGIERFVDDNGVFDLNQADIDPNGESDNKKISSSDDTGNGLEYRDDDGTWLVKAQSSYEDRRDVLVKMWDEEGLKEKVEDPDVDIAKSDIADLTDFTAASLFNDGLVDEVERRDEIFLPVP